MRTTSLALLILIQVQESPRLSKAAMVAAALVFIMGVSLLIYFFRRYRRTEKELQDEWDRPEQSLFAHNAPSVSKEEVHSLAEAEGAVSTNASENEELEIESAKTEPISIPPSSEPQPPGVTESLTEALESEAVPVILASTPDTEMTQRPTQVLSSESSRGENAETGGAPAVIASAPDVETTQHQTGVLSSEVQPKSTDGGAITDSILFDEDIWAGLEMPEEEVPEVTQRLGVPKPAAEPAQASEPHEAAEPAPTQAKTESLGAARVDSHSGRERFEPPDVSIAYQEPAAAERQTRILASPPTLSEQQADVEAVKDSDASSAEIEVPIVAPAPANIAATMRVRAGSVLGLPAERSHSPLVLGAPVKPRDEIGIGALSNYGRDSDGGAGHGGTITLAAVILLLGGGIAAYLYVPSVQSRVNAMIARARGIDPNPPAAVEQPKARVFAGRNEANKNMVKARGAVDNISEELLSNLAIEISLERGNGASPELRQYPIKPAQLAPQERGVYEFEYNGNRATGFGGYRIVRLLSGESEIKFATPGRTG